MYSPGSWLFRFRYVLPGLAFAWVIFLADPAPPGLVVGAPLILAGETLRLWSARHCDRSSRTLAPVPAPARLVTSGPFARVRNPIYIANILMYEGVSVLFCPNRFWIHVSILVLFIVQYTIIIRYEEERLTALFGDAYRRYSEEVRRFLPRFSRPEVAALNSFRYAIRSERGTLFGILLVALVYGAVMLFASWKS